MTAGSERGAIDGIIMSSVSCPDITCALTRGRTKTVELPPCKHEDLPV